MSTFDGNNFYYSGQGVVMIGDRDSTTGKPKGLIPVGNVSALKLGLATTVLEHKESQSGNRAIDLRLVTELKSSLSMTVENFSKEGLASALAGSWAQSLAGSVTGEIMSIYPGRVTAMANIKVSSAVVKRTDGSQTLVAYSNAQTAYDYLINTDAGSVKFNDGQSGLDQSAMCTGSTLTAPTSISVAGTGVITLTWSATPPASILAAGAGGSLSVKGFTGGDAGLFNGKAWPISEIDASAKTVKLVTPLGGKTITLGVPLIVPSGAAGTFDYSYETQNRIDALTEPSTEKYLRFEGLNTADGGNPVVVEVYRFIVDPLKELALIGEGVGPFVLDGNTLADNLQLSGSKFFKVTQLR